MSDIGILLEPKGGEIPYWKFRLVRETYDRADINVHTFAYNRVENEAHNKTFFGEYGSKILAFYLTHVSTPSDFRSVSIEKLNDFGDLSQVDTQSETGLINFDEDVHKHIESYSLDLLCSLEPQEFGEPLKQIPSTGFIEFDFLQKLRRFGTIPGFQEIKYRKPTTKISLHLTSPNGARQEIASSKFSTRFSSLTRQVNKLFHESIYLLPSLNWNNSEFQGDEVSLKKSDVGAPPNPIIIFWFFVVLWWRTRVNRFEKRFKQETWNIGVIQVPIRSVFDQFENQSVDWLRWDNTKNHADPFGMEFDGNRYCFYEEFTDKPASGSLKVGQVNGEELRNKQSVLSADHHRSYPFLFTHQEDIYCVPEQFNNKKVVLYRAVNFPHSWEPVNTIISNQAVIDPTIVKIDDCWWMFGTDAEIGPSSKLCIWFSRSLLGTWHEHPANPVKMDISSVRPAGEIFNRNDRWFRPAQDCSTGYGSRVVIHEILELSKSRYREKHVETVEPFTGEYSDGIHTLSSLGELTLIDGKKYHWFKNVLTFWNNLSV